MTTELKESRVHTLYDPTSFTPLIRLEQALPIPEKIKPLGDIMEAETEMSLPKIVKDRFNRLEKEINEDNLTEEMQIWLKQMGMTKESLKADFIPAKPEKQKLTKHYYHTDQIGTPLALITEKGEKAWEIITDPYGRRVREENPNKLYQPIRMQGQHYDAESNLHYNRHRYYDPNIGRYISQDPIGLDSGIINSYLYAINSPVNFIDPTGEFIPLIVVAAFVGKALVGAAIGGTVDAGLQLAGQAGSQMWNNYKNDRDIFDFKKECFKIDWRSVGVSAAFGTVAPGFISSAKTVNNSRKAIGALKSQSANTVNRANKIAGRIEKHEGIMKETVTVYGKWFLAKKAVNCVSTNCLADQEEEDCYEYE